MTDAQNPPEQPAEDLPTRSAEKDPADWVTGEEPMTGPQASYLRTLSQEAGEDFDESITKAEASQRIDELQQRTGRGADGGEDPGGGPPAAA